MDYRNQVDSSNLQSLSLKKKNIFKEKKVNIKIISKNNDRTDAKVYGKKIWF